MFGSILGPYLKVQASHWVKLITYHADVCIQVQSYMVRLSTFAPAFYVSLASAKKERLGVR